MNLDGHVWNRSCRTVIGPWLVNLDVKFTVDDDDKIRGQTTCEIGDRFVKFHRVASINPQTIESEFVETNITTRNELSYFIELWPQHLSSFDPGNYQYFETYSFDHLFDILELDMNMGDHL